MMQFGYEFSCLHILNIVLIPLNASGALQFKKVGRYLEQYSKATTVKIP